jgi:undecaprenyl-diphosphatase
MMPSVRPALVHRWPLHVAAAILLVASFVWDKPIYETIRHARTPFLDWLTEEVASLRGAALPIVVSLVLMGFGVLRSRTKIWRGGAALLLAVALSGAVVSVLKPTFARPGPEGYLKTEPGDSWLAARYGRFPSSHAAVLFGGATALAAFLPITAPVAYTLAVLVVYERVYHATHFPSDILAGIWIGLAVAQLIVARLARFKGWEMDLSPAWRESLGRRGAQEPTWANSDPIEELEPESSAAG